MEKDKQKFYWLKLDKDFFNEYKVRSLMSEKKGDTYIVILLQLMNESLNYNGVLRYSKTRAYSVPELACVIGRSVKILEETLKVLKEKELIEIQSDGTIIMKVNVGSETGKAIRMRESRSQSAQDPPEIRPESARLGTEIRDKRLENRLEEDIRIKEIAMRLLEMGYDSAFVDETLEIFNKGLCPHTADFYQKIVNTMTDANIYNKEGYIYKMAENEVKA